MFSEARLEPRVDVPSTRWHNLRDRFKILFRKEILTNVETWYNTQASRDSRDAFQRCMKSIQNNSATDGREAPPTPVNGLPPIGGRSPDSSDSVALHRARHFAVVYGSILSVTGKERLSAWALNAPDSLLDDVRTSFTAIQGTLNAKSVTKGDFVPKKGDENKDTLWHRKRIDWMSGKVYQHMQQTVLNPMSGAGDNPMLDQKRMSESGERLVKPKSQFDGNAVLKSLGLDGGDGVEKLREKREAAANAAVCTTEANGCVVYSRASKAQNRVQASSRDRIIPTAVSHSQWQTTTKETIRDHSGSALAKPERIHPDSHPSMSRVTASLGMVLPHPSLQPK